MKSSSKTLIPVLLLLILMGCQNSTTTNSESNVVVETEKPLVKLLIEEQWPAAYKNQDTTLLSQILHSTFRLIDDQGQVYSKYDEISYVAQYGTSYDTYNFETTQLEVYENGAAKVVGKGSIAGSDVDGNYTLSYQASYSLVKENGRWQVIHNHVSGVKENRL